MIFYCCQLGWRRNCLDVKLDKFSQSEEVTTREVENVLVILKNTYEESGRCPICYFEFVTNPTSFAQTIENVFYTSFLIRVRRLYKYNDSPAFFLQ